MKGKRVLVTGADGFIGSHLVERLVKDGASVRALVYYNAFNHWGWLEQLPADILSEVDVQLGDIRHADGLRKIMKGCQVVFHLAALIGIPYSYHSPAAYMETNAIGTLNVLQSALDLGLEKVVHTSTSEVYGSARYVPIDENHPLQAQSPYAASKIAADKLAESFFRSFDLPVAIIRPFNTYGPRQSGRAVIPTIISQLLKGQQLKLGSLHPRRDFTFVTDTVNGFVCIALADRAVGDVTNIGNGREVSIGELVGMIAEIIGRQADIVHDEERVRPPLSEVDCLLAKTEKAASIGWSPSVSLEEGLRKTVEWMRHFRGYKSGYTV